MSLIRYYVDLRPYSLEERDQYCRKLERFAFLCSPFLDKIGLFEVFWDLSDPLFQVIGIPEHLVSVILPE